MAVTYKQPSSEALSVLSQARDKYHRDRLDGVRVGMIFAFAPVDEETGERKGDALKLHGVPCFALARIVSTKDRVAGLPDALIYVDGDEWKGLTKAEKLALLDHELTHLEFPASGGEDSAGRPKLKMRPHDHEFGFFNEVAERHGRASQEVQQASRWVDECGQLYLLGFEVTDKGTEMVTAAKPKAVAAKVSRNGGPATATTFEDLEAKAAAGSQPTGRLEPADELVAVLGKVKGDELVKRLRALLDEPTPIRPATLAAMYAAETARASSGRPRKRLLDLLAPHTEAEHGRQDIWAALLVSYSAGAPKLEHVEAGMPVVVDLAVVRHVQAVELARGKKAREAVVSACEERLADLYEEGGQS